ncbi:beta strand repeat-containing protein [Synoicihabitans lomoniglobus]|uniref:DUF11 domain-containing protein n=1 Tax=Synoicihabitans lomoniglobus TaxID=2909285 RepID=A0AAF0A0A9_9BACT|nr:hypothetical protein [Opitutaceae bacterium LMO-M01]WED64117.1 hypothetical protein PXH66_17405 [Opitutaceae bacterium LMO-M01]
MTVAALMLAGVTGISVLRAAAPAAGSSIGNQASATYTDASNTERTATSNVAVTIVQQVASLTLTSDNTKSVAPGGQVSFPHTLTNTGNGTDAYALSFTQGAGDNFDLSGLAIYADANGDGRADSSTPITSTGDLPSGASFSFVVSGTVPTSVASDDTAAVSVSAVSGFDGSATAANNDTAIVSENGVINVTKSMSSSSGAPGSGPYTYTLTFSNTGNTAATAVTLIDDLPTGLVYVDGSARWSGSASALTDANAGDPAGINYSYNDPISRQVKAVIDSVAPGQTGTVTFQVSIDANAAPGDINNQVSYTYSDGVATVGPRTSNTVGFTVSQSAAVSIVGETVASAPQGSTVAFTNVITNNGLGEDTFNVTVDSNDFPAGTAFRLAQADGATALLDSNGDGIPDTGPLAANASYTVILLATLPVEASGGPYTANKTARSVLDSGVAATAADTLTAIVLNTVDLTNDSAGPSAPGAGAGAEADPVTTLTVNAGETARFSLYVNNTGGRADTFDLTASTVADHSSIALPAGWTVVFRDVNEAVIARTPVINAGADLLVYADVIVPAGSEPVTESIYFRVLSPNSGSGDIKHDAVSVAAERSLTLTPNNVQQIYAGGSVVYRHTLTNNGNVLEGDNIASTVSLASADSLNGWTSIIYHDVNGNGVIDPGEPVVTDLSFVSNSGAGLEPGESVELLVKVFSPEGAPAGSADTTTLSATTANGTRTETVPAAVSATDVSTVISSDLTILKEQALDADNNGTADTAYSINQITTGAVPGSSILYKITIKNIGSTNADNVVVSDSTPTFTVYDATTPAAASQGSVGSTPADGSAGALEFNLGTIAPSGTATVSFGVRINQ